MKKFFSLLKAVMSQDMNLFVYKAKKNASGIKKAMMPILLALLVMFAIGSMYYPIAYELSKEGSVYLILTISIALPSILALMEGIYKSQGILFEAKDSELLFSLPISKKQILLARTIKLFVFQFLYSLLFIVPGIVIYIFYDRPDFYFYAITLLMLLLVPIIPTTIGCVLGYFIQKFSVKFKSKKLVQTIVTFAMILVFMTISFRLEGITEEIIENANSINETIARVYYPVRAYSSLLKDFNLLTLVKLLLVNIITVALFVYIASQSYFKVLSKTKEHTASSKSTIDLSKLSFKPKSSLFALIKKDMIRYFSSPVYMINTAFGLVLLIIATVSLCMNFDSAITSLAYDEMPPEDIEVLRMMAPKLYLIAVIAMSFMTSITSSSISLEGKTFNISKSLPIKTEKILMSKVLMSNIITIPVILICDIIFFVSFRPTLLDIIATIISSFIAPSIAAVFGLIINLKYPKMDASSDSEVVKQSMSSMVSVISGIMMSFVFGIATFFLAGFGDNAIIVEVAFLMVILAILWMILKKYGKRRYREIEI